MYADRFARPEGIKPGSLTAAIAINAGIFAALALSAPEFTGRIRDKVLTTTNVFVPPPPDPIKPEIRRPLRELRHMAEQIERVPPLVETRSYTDPLPPLPPLPPLDPGVGTRTGTTIDPPLAPPVLTDPMIDQRYARDFQSDYPAGERRMANEGKVVIRVLVGVDGRVRQVDCVTAASDAFWRATERQALNRWRFKPATRDGTPIEAWRTLTVRFEMDDAG